MTAITSTANPLVKDLVRLRSRRHRDDAGRFLIEGRREVNRALAAAVPVEMLVVCPDLGGEVPAGLDVDEPHGELRIVHMAEAPFRKVSARQGPDGILAVAPFLATDLDRLRLPSGALVLWLEGIEKPGNLGAMLRTADGVGVDAVIVSDPVADIHNPSVVRASQGALFTVPLAVTTTTAAVTRFRAEGIRIAALTPTAPTSLWEADLSGPVAVAIGAEDRGLSEPALEAAATRCLIPMAGQVDSLNASVAAAIVLYEVTRRRQSS